MPCFEGLAVSIHTPTGPLPEYSIQKNQRLRRISSYIPVPDPQISLATGQANPSSFAISITLLTPGQAVPYSKPQSSGGFFPTEPKYVAGLPGTSEERGIYAGIIRPFRPCTSSENETVAAYIHFDGRTKEEVATLLRRGEETWVNSRWVSVPQSEGGGLAEREFLFREVGLERWLNGLDLQGEKKEVDAQIERRKRRLEKKRRKKIGSSSKSSDEDDTGAGLKWSKNPKNNILRYGEDASAPLESLSADESLSSSDTDSDEDIPEPEAAGQIKVSLYRVFASGEIKRGEYSPQFGAHDDDDMETVGNGTGDNNADVDHTTTFAKPKSLDPRSISTQTVTGIDPPHSPYATFTFFYRGRKQLQKMGILPKPLPTTQPSSTSTRKSNKLDLSSLKPLNSKNAAGFTGYRDSNTQNEKFKDLDDMDSDDDDAKGQRFRKKSNGILKEEAEDDDDVAVKKELSAEEAQSRADLAEGVKKMHLKRQRSQDPPSPGLPPSSEHDLSVDTSVQNNLANTGPSPSQSANPNTSSAPPSRHASLSQAVKAHDNTGSSVGSPFKKQRASISDPHHSSEDAPPMPSLTSATLSGFREEGNKSSGGTLGGILEASTSDIPDNNVGASNPDNADKNMDEVEAALDLEASDEKSASASKTIEHTTEDYQSSDPFKKQER